MLVRLSLAQVLLPLILASLAGCGSQDTKAADTAIPAPGETAMLPSPLKAAASVGAPAPSCRVAGGLFDEQYVNDWVNAVGYTATYAADFSEAQPSSLDGLAYAIYHADMSYSSTTPLIRLRWIEQPELGDPSKVWIGLGNFTLDRWDWYQPQALDELILPSLDSYISAGDPPRLLLTLALTGTQTAWLDYLEVGVSALPLDDSIFIVPEQSFVNEGTVVRCTVYVNNCANELWFMNGARIAVRKGTGYVTESINLGAPGGDKDDPDGIWAVQEGAMGYIVSAYWNTVAHDGYMWLDVNLTPLGPDTKAADTGAIFNFELKVNVSTELTFIREDGIDFTYYSDGEADTWYWANDTNAGYSAITAVGLF